MRRTPSRLFGALAMLWSLVVIGGPTLVHPCPTHGGLSAAPAALATTIVGHDMATMHHAEMPHKAPSHDGAVHQCQCPGGCCAAATIALGSSMTVERFSTESRVTTAPFIVSLRVAVERAAHSLPFANGPPAAGLL